MIPESRGSPELGIHEHVVVVDVVVDRAGGKCGQATEQVTLEFGNDPLDDLPPTVAIDQTDRIADPSRSAKIPFDLPSESGMCEALESPIHRCQGRPDLAQQGKRLWAGLRVDPAGEVRDEPDQPLLAILVAGRHELGSVVRLHDTGNNHLRSVRCDMVQGPALHLDERDLASGPHHLQDMSSPSVLVHGEVQVVFPVQWSERGPDAIVLQEHVRPPCLVGHLDGTHRRCL